jgi:hypothetical protein
MGIHRMILPEVLLYRSLHGKNDSRQTQLLWNDMFGVIRASIKRKHKSEDSTE